MEDNIGNVSFHVITPLQDAFCALLEETMPARPEYHPTCKRERYGDGDARARNGGWRMRLIARNILFFAELDEHRVVVYNPRMLIHLVHLERLIVDLADPTMAEQVWAYVLHQCDHPVFSKQHNA